MWRLKAYVVLARDISTLVCDVKRNEISHVLVALVKSAPSAGFHATRQAKHTDSACDDYLRISEIRRLSTLRIHLHDNQMAKKITYSGLADQDAERHKLLNLVCSRGQEEVIQGPGGGGRTRTYDLRIMRTQEGYAAF
jgi:hypothetical protein